MASKMPVGNSKWAVGSVITGPGFLPFYMEFILKQFFLRYYGSDNMTH